KPLIFLLCIAVLAISAVALIWGARERQVERVVAGLPALPTLDASTRALGPVLEEAHTLVRDDPSSENIGKLGKIYHANYFYAEAAACYQGAMELDPDAARWPYLLNYVLE